MVAKNDMICIKCIPAYHARFNLLSCRKHNLMRYTPLFLLLILLLYSCGPVVDKTETPLNISGIYPHLAYYNQQGECGTGAVVPWAGRLWVITYGPHLPEGSSDKLYEITPDLKQITREESIGGTPANRMIHRESEQLFIGPYAVDRARNVRTIQYTNMTGRLTGNAQHLFQPDEMIYFGTMEEGFYEADVASLEVQTLFKDARTFVNEGNPDSAGVLLPGAHGKGLYSGQGVLVYSNNGEKGQEALERFDVESGVLAEWDGVDWKVIRRNQFVEVTGPGGIYGNPDPENDPIWVTGWDHKSLLVGVRDRGEWSFYRLPKASHSYDGAHGWNTEWPRIRDVGTAEAPDYLMTMHGMFWRFPATFSGKNSAGIRPRSAYLKVIGDFARWNGRLVMGCDDSAQKEFLNKRKVKGDIEGPGQSNSNLWFIPAGTPDSLGPATASGAVWLEEQVQAGEPSEPFLFAGWDHRTAWLVNHDDAPVELFFQADHNGEGDFETFRSVRIGAGASGEVRFTEQEQGEWIRIVADSESKVTAQFCYAEHDARSAEPDQVFTGLLHACEAPMTGGLLYGLGEDRRALGISARHKGKDAGYYELDANMQLVRKDDPVMKKFIDEKFEIPSEVVSVEASSVLVVDDRGRRWRFPKGDECFTELTREGRLRISREVATERDLLNLHGTFYELPAENADGFAKVRPVASHDFRIHDYASYRGLLVMTGVDPAVADENPHVFASADGKAAVWAGAIDDLWKLGKPVGTGGPWKESRVLKGEPSDPYLIGFYDQKTLSLNHDMAAAVTFTVEIEPVGHGPWMQYMEVTVQPGEMWEHTFEDGFQSRWIRFVADHDCVATAWLEYR